MRDLDQAPIKYFVPDEISYITECIWNVTACTAHRQREDHTLYQILHHVRRPRPMILADLIENNLKAQSTLVQIVQDAFEKSFLDYERFHDYVSKNFAAYLKGRKIGTQQRKPKTKQIPIILNKAALTLSVNGKPDDITDRQYQLFEPLFKEKPGKWVSLSIYGSIKMTSPPRIKASLKPALKNLIESNKQGNGYRIYTKYKTKFA